MTRDRMEARLAELRTDFGDGERALRELDARREQLQVSLLRVGGAIQVLEELLSAEPSEPSATSRTDTVTAGT
jgi:hypothetical protein